MSSISDSLSEGSKKAFNFSRDTALNTLNETGNLVKETGNMAGKTLKGATNLASNTFKRGSDIADNLLHGRVKGTLGASKNLVTGTVGEVIDDIEGGIQYGLSNKYVSTTLKVLIALYAAFAAPSLPKGIASFFDNSLVRIAVAILIVYLATKDSSLAILVALAFVLTLQTANKHKLINTSESVSPRGQLSWLPSVGRHNVERFSNQEADEAEYSPLPHEHTNVVNYHEQETQPVIRQTYDEDTLSKMNIHENTEIGDNKVPGANQNSCVQSWENEHCTQGLNYPRGYDEAGFPYSRT